MTKQKKESSNKKSISTVAAIVIGSVVAVSILYGVYLTVTSIMDRDMEDEDSLVKDGYVLAETGYDAIFIDSYVDLETKILEQDDGYVVYSNMPNAEDFEDDNFLAVSYEVNSCGETVEFSHSMRIGPKFGIYYDVSTYCGVCAPEKHVDFFNIGSDSASYIRVFIYEKVTRKETCDDDMTVKKPILYIYPTEEMDVTVSLGRPELLTSSYPKYTGSWTVHATPDGNLYDYATGHNYYALYWEGRDETALDMSEGFVVAGADTAEFLEEKLAILGLNEYETEEFITYWIARMEANPYNFVRFRTLAEINEYMPLEFSVQPDTLIRVLMDFKALSAPIEVAEQELEPAVREGFVIVEWGGVEH